MAKLQQFECAGNLTPLTWRILEPLPAKLVRSERALRSGASQSVSHGAQSMIGTIIRASEVGLPPEWASRSAISSCMLSLPVHSENAHFASGRNERPYLNSRTRLTQAEAARSHTEREWWLQRAFMPKSLACQTIPQQVSLGCKASLQGGTASDVALVCNISYNGCSFDLAIDQSLVWAWSLSLWQRRKLVYKHLPSKLDGSTHSAYLFVWSLSLSSVFSSLQWIWAFPRFI